MSATRKQVDLAPERRGAELIVHIDRPKTLALDSAVTASVPGIAVAGGAATLTDVRIRRLQRVAPR